MTALKFIVTHDTDQNGFCCETNFDVGVCTEMGYTPLMRAERKSAYVWRIAYIHPDKPTNYDTLRRKYESDAMEYYLFYATRAWDNANNRT